VCSTYIQLVSYQQSERPRSHNDNKDWPGGVSSLQDRAEQRYTTIWRWGCRRTETTQPYGKYDFSGRIVQISIYCSSSTHQSAILRFLSILRSRHGYGKNGVHRRSACCIELINTHQCSGQKGSHPVVSADVCSIRCPWSYMFHVDVAVVWIHQGMSRRGKREAELKVKAHTRSWHSDQLSPKILFSYI
jgi:hypothetical protein